MAAISALQAAPLTDAQLKVLRERDARFAARTPSPAALELARSFGHEDNVDGLRVLMQLRDARLLRAAAEAYLKDGPRELPDAMETLIIEHYADGAIREPLLAFFGSKLDDTGRFPKYSQRKLFELLYADLQAGWNPGEHARRIVATDLKDIEPQLVALLPELDPVGASAIVILLGQRRHASAVPALQALQARVQLHEYQSRVLENIGRSLLQIGTPAAVQAVLERLRWLGRSTDPLAKHEVAALLSDLSALPPGSRPHYAELRAALPADMNESAWSGLARLIRARNEKRGIPDLLLAIPKVRGHAPVDALLSVGSADDWRAARERLGRGDTGLPPLLVDSMQKQLDAAIADPVKFAEARRIRDLKQALDDGQLRYSQRKERFAAYRTRDPARYAREWHDLIEQREIHLASYKGVPRTDYHHADIVREWNALASFLRFELRRPDDAIAAYQAASRHHRATLDKPVDFKPLFIADIHRFDRADAANAIKQYRIVHGELARAAAEDARREVHGYAWLRGWLDREIGYLQDGRRFSGTLTRDEAAGIYSWLFIAGDHYASGSLAHDLVRRAQAEAASRRGVVDMARLLQSLEPLPPSQFHLRHVFFPGTKPPAAEGERFFAKHDPAGYLSAALRVALAARSELRAPPDARWGTPE